MNTKTNSPMMAELDRLALEAAYANCCAERREAEHAYASQSARIEELEQALNWTLNALSGNPAFDGNRRLAAFRALLAGGGK
jgi:hypothetical protein